MDRVVSGYPKAAADKFVTELGYEDQLMVCGELFHFLLSKAMLRLRKSFLFVKLG